jgi:hypothetical protein
MTSTRIQDQVVYKKYLEKKPDTPLVYQSLVDYMTKILPIPLIDPVSLKKEFMRDLCSDGAAKGEATSKTNLYTGSLDPEEEWNDVTTSNYDRLFTRHKASTLPDTLTYYPL